MSSLLRRTFTSRSVSRITATATAVALTMVVDAGCAPAASKAELAAAAATPGNPSLVLPAFAGQWSAPKNEFAIVTGSVSVQRREAGFAASGDLASHAVDANRVHLEGPLSTITEHDANGLYGLPASSQNVLGFVAATGTWDGVPVRGVCLAPTFYSTPAKVTVKLLFATGQTAEFGDLIQE